MAKVQHRDGSFKSVGSSNPTFNQTHAFGEACESRFARALHANRFPSRREIRALNIGADELSRPLAEWVFRHRPQEAEQPSRAAIRKYCSSLLSEIEAAR